MKRQELVGAQSIQSTAQPHGIEAPGVSVGVLREELEKRQRVSHHAWETRRLLVTSNQAATFGLIEEKALY